LQGILNELEDLGASLVALTPQKPEHNRASTDKSNLNFHLLTDPGNAYAAELGIRFELPADLRQVYQGLGIDLVAYNGDESWTLPVPARYVVDGGGIIRAADVGVDYTHRPEPGKTLDDLRGLG
jgi:peroxiredoxin